MVATPIFQTSTYAFRSCAEGAARFAGEEPGYIYTRMGNPTTNALEEAVATMEGGFAGLATASGMAATCAVAFSLLGQAQHSEFAQWHAPGANSVPFDFLDQVPNEVIEGLVAAGGSRVVVHGDGLVPDTGKELASELAGRGMRNVHFVVGGLAAVHQEIAP